MWLSWLVPLKDDIMLLLLFEVYHHSDEADAAHTCCAVSWCSADAQVRPVIGWWSVDRCGCRSSSCWGSSPVLRLLQLQSTFTYCFSIITFIWLLLWTFTDSFYLMVHYGFIVTACDWVFFTFFTFCTLECIYINVHVFMDLSCSLYFVFH